MKNFVTILLLLSIIGCKKENDTPVSEEISTRANVSRSQSFFYTGASSASSIGDNGLSADIDVKKLQGGSYEMKSVWIAFYFIDTAGRSKWTQWGYALHKDLGYITIIAHWDFGIGNFYQPPTTHLNSSPFVFNQKTTFAIRNVGGTKWRYSRNGIYIEEVDLKATSITNVEIKLESQSASANIGWPLINVQNFSTLKNGQWVTVPYAYFSGSFYANTGLSVFGCEGMLQNNLLQAGELNLGNCDPISSGFTQLW